MGGKMRKAGFFWSILVCVVGFATCLHASAQSATKEAFRFGEVDLTLLEQVELLDQRFEKEGLVYADATLQEYLDRVGSSILPSGELPEKVRWRFRVLRDPQANAFALPNGSIYINTGLLSLLENEDQLASVLAHEAVHVLNRHSYLSFRSYRKKMAAINIVNYIGGSAGYSSNIGAQVVSLIGTIVPSILAATITGYRRELETEADLYAVDKLSATNHDTSAMVMTFQLLGREQDLNQEVVFYSDHPKLEERMKYVKAAIQARAASSPTDSTGSSERYLQATETVVQRDILLAISANRPRTAFAHAQKLVKHHPDSSENMYLLAEVYRALGPRTPEPAAEELTKKARNDAQKLTQKFTPDEQIKELLAKPAGKAAWEENQRKAEESYRKALELDSSNVKAHRGLGFLFEAVQRNADAVAEYRAYLEQIPNAPDQDRIQRRLDVLENRLKTTVERPQ